MISGRDFLHSQHERLKITDEDNPVSHLPHKKDSGSRPNTSAQRQHFSTMKVSRLPFAQSEVCERVLPVRTRQFDLWQQYPAAHK